MSDHAGPWRTWRATSPADSIQASSKGSKSTWTACPACAGKLHETRSLDHSLAAIFAGVRPDAALEDRVIHSLRESKSRFRLALPRYARIGLAAAAVLLVASAGAVMNDLILKGELPFPGAADEGRARAENSLRQVTFATDFDDSGSIADQIAGGASLAYLSKKRPTRGALGFEYRPHRTRRPLPAVRCAIRRRWQELRKERLVALGDESRNSGLKDAESKHSSQIQGWIFTPMEADRCSHSPADADSVIASR